MVPSYLGVPEMGLAGLRLTCLDISIPTIGGPIRDCEGHMSLKPRIRLWKTGKETLIVQLKRLAI